MSVNVMRLFDLFDFFYYSLMPYNGRIQSVNIITIWTSPFVSRGRRTYMVQDLLVDRNGDILFEEYDSTGYIYRKWQTVTPGFRISKLFSIVSDFESERKRTASSQSDYWEMHLELEDGSERVMTGDISLSKNKLKSVSNSIRLCIPIDNMKLLDGRTRSEEDEEWDF